MEDHIHQIIRITGEVHYPITLDPSVWIFDEKRFEMRTRFPDVEGLGMNLGPFLDRAEPLPTATHVICRQQDGTETLITLEEARQAVLRFSRDGKAIRPDGPAHLYFHDGRNASNPIHSLRELEVVSRPNSQQAR